MTTLSTKEQVVRILRMLSKNFSELADLVETERTGRSLNEMQAGTLPTQILAVLKAQQGMPMTTREVFASLEARGTAPVHHKNPYGSVRTTLMRLVRSGRIEKVGEGRYRFPD